MKTPSNPLHFIFRPHKERRWIEWGKGDKYTKCLVNDLFTLVCQNQTSILFVKLESINLLNFFLKNSKFHFICTSSHITWHIKLHIFSH